MRRRRRSWRTENFEGIDLNFLDTNIFSPPREVVHRILVLRRRAKLINFKVVEEAKPVPIVAGFPQRLLPQIGVRATAPPQPGNPGCRRLESNDRRGIINLTIRKPIPLPRDRPITFFYSFLIPNRTDGDGFFVVVLSSENPTKNRKNDEEDIEGVPAFLDGSGSEEVGGEREKGRDCEKEEEEGDDG